MQNAENIQYLFPLPINPIRNRDDRFIQIKIKNNFIFST